MASKPAAKKKSEQIKEDLSVVRLVSRVGQFVIVPDDVEWINPTTKRTVKGITLHFGDNGVCELDPVLDADTIKAYRDLVAEGRDPRVHECGLMEIAKDAILAPFPKWDTTAPDSVVQMVEALGLDPETCLRYELQKGEPRAKVVKALEAKVDEPVAEDALDEPEL